MKRRYGAKKAIQAACLGVGITMASWGMGSGTAKAVAVAPTYQLSGTISPTSNLSDVYVYYGLNSSSFPISDNISHIFIDSIAAGDTQSFSFIIADDPDNTDYWQEGYTVFALYDANLDGDTDGVTVGMNSVKGSVAIGKPWEAYFDLSESTVQGWLEDGDTENLRDFFGGNFFGWDHLMSNSGEPLSLINFSNGAYGGTANATTSQVPLPDTAWLFLSSGLGICLVRKVKRFFE